MRKPEIIDEQVVYQSSLTRVLSAKIELPNGKSAEWDWIDNANSVAVLPIDGGVMSIFVGNGGLLIKEKFYKFQQVHVLQKMRKEESNRFIMS